MNKGIVYSVTFTIILALLCENIAWAQGPQAVLPLSRNILPNVNELSLPDNIAKINKRFKGNKDKLVILVQDMHANYEAQMNSAKAMRKLADSKLNGTKKLLAVEGAGGKLDVRYFRTIPDTEARDKVLDYYLKSAYINGAEYLAMTGPENLAFYGVEDMEVYRENLEAFKKVQDKKLIVSRYIKELAGRLYSLIDTVYVHSDLEKAIIRYHTAKMNYSDYMEILLRYIEGIERYPNFSRAVMRDEYTRIDLMGLMEETEEIEEEIKERLYTVEEKLLDRLMTDLIILGHLVNLELNRRELKRHKVDLGKIARKANKILEKYGRPGIEVQDFDLAESYRFYELGLKRDEILIKNFLRRMEEADINVGFLYAGGFHTPRIAEELEREGISYVVVTPRITRVTPSINRRYIDIMMNTKTRFEKMLEGNTKRLAPPVILTNPDDITGRREGLLQELLERIAIYLNPRELRKWIKSLRRAGVSRRDSFLRALLRMRLGIDKRRHFRDAVVAVPQRDPIKVVVIKVERVAKKSSPPLPKSLLLLAVMTVLYLAATNPASAGELGLGMLWVSWQVFGPAEKRGNERLKVFLLGLVVQVIFRLGTTKDCQKWTERLRHLMKNRPELGPSIMQILEMALRSPKTTPEGLAAVIGLLRRILEDVETRHLIKRETIMALFEILKRDDLTKRDFHNWGVLIVGISLLQRERFRPIIIEMTQRALNNEWVNPANAKELAYLVSYTALKTSPMAVQAILPVLLRDEIGEEDLSTFADALVNIFSQMAGPRPGYLEDRIISQMEYILRNPKEHPNACLVLFALFKKQVIMKTCAGKETIGAIEYALKNISPAVQDYSRERYYEEGVQALVSVADERDDLKGEIYGILGSIANSPGLYLSLREKAGLAGLELSERILRTEAGERLFIRALPVFLKSQDLPTKILRLVGIIQRHVHALTEEIIIALGDTLFREDIDKGNRNIIASTLSYIALNRQELHNAIEGVVQRIKESTLEGKEALERLIRNALLSRRLPAQMGEAIGHWRVKVVESPGPGENGMMKVALSGIGKKRRVRLKKEFPVSSLGKKVAENVLSVLNMYLESSQERILEPELRHIRAILEHLDRMAKEGRIYLASGLTEIKGFGDSERIVLDEDVFKRIEGIVALFHEAGHSYFAANPDEVPNGLNVHTYLRGMGKGARDGKREPSKIEEALPEIPRDGTKMKVGLQDLIFERWRNRLGPPDKLKDEDKYKVLTVCGSNIVRSVMMAWLLNKEDLIVKNGFFHVYSRGMSIPRRGDTELPSIREEIFKALRAIDTSMAQEIAYVHEPSEVLNTDISSSSIILAATRGIRRQLLARRIGGHGRILLMTELLPKEHPLYGKDLPDLGENGYTARDIYDLLENTIPVLRHALGQVMEWHRREKEAELAPLLEEYSRGLKDMKALPPGETDSPNVRDIQARIRRLSGSFSAFPSYYVHLEGVISYGIKIKRNLFLRFFHKSGFDGLYEVKPVWDDVLGLVFGIKNEGGEWIAFGCENLGEELPKGRNTVNGRGFWKKGRTLEEVLAPYRDSRISGEDDSLDEAGRILREFSSLAKKEKTEERIPSDELRQVVNQYRGQNIRANAKGVVSITGFTGWYLLLHSGVKKKARYSLRFLWRDGLGLFIALLDERKGEFIIFDPAGYLIQAGRAGVSGKALNAEQVIVVKGRSYEDYIQGKECEDVLKGHCSRKSLVSIFKDYFESGGRISEDLDKRIKAFPGLEGKTGKTGRVGFVPFPRRPLYFSLVGCRKKSYRLNLIRDPVLGLVVYFEVEGRPYVFTLERYLEGYRKGGPDRELQISGNRLPGKVFLMKGTILRFPPGVYSITVNGTEQSFRLDNGGVATLEGIANLSDKEGIVRISLTLDKPLVVLIGTTQASVTKLSGTMLISDLIEDCIARQHSKAVLVPSLWLADLIARPIDWALIRFGKRPLNRYFKEDFIVPLIEECALWGLLFVDPLIYAVLRFLFIIAHAFQDYDPPDGQERTLVEKLKIPLYITAAAFIVLTICTFVSFDIWPVFFVGLIVHIYLNRYVTHTGSRLQKGIVARTRRRRGGAGFQAGVRKKLADGSDNPHYGQMNRDGKTDPETIITGFDFNNILKVGLEEYGITIILDNRFFEEGRIDADLLNAPFLFRAVLEAEAELARGREDNNWLSRLKGQTIAIALLDKSQRLLENCRNDKPVTVDGTTVHDLVGINPDVFKLPEAAQEIFMLAGVVHELRHAALPPGSKDSDFEEEFTKRDLALTKRLIEERGLTLGNYDVELCKISSGGDYLAAIISDITSGISAEGAVRNINFNGIGTDLQAELKEKLPGVIFAIREARPPDDLRDIHRRILVNLSQNYDVRLIRGNGIKVVIQRRTLGMLFSVTEDEIRVNPEVFLVRMIVHTLGRVAGGDLIENDQEGLDRLIEIYLNEKVIPIGSIFYPFYEKAKAGERPKTIFGWILCYLGEPETIAPIWEDALFKAGALWLIQDIFGNLWAPDPLMYFLMISIVVYSFAHVVVKLIIYENYGDLTTFFKDFLRFLILAVLTTIPFLGVVLGIDIWFSLPRNSIHITPWIAYWIPYFTYYEGWVLNFRWHMFLNRKIIKYLYRQNGAQLDYRRYLRESTNALRKYARALISMAAWESVSELEGDNLRRLTGHLKTIGDSDSLNIVAAVYSAIDLIHNTGSATDRHNSMLKKSAELRYLLQRYVALLMWPRVDAYYRLLVFINEHLEGGYTIDGLLWSVTNDREYGDIINNLRILGCNVRDLEKYLTRNKRTIRGNLKSLWDIAIRITIERDQNQPYAGLLKFAIAWEKSSKGAYNYLCVDPLSKEWDKRFRVRAARGPNRIAIMPLTEEVLEWLGVKQQWKKAIIGAPILETFGLQGVRKGIKNLALAFAGSSLLLGLVILAFKASPAVWVVAAFISYAFAIQHRGVVNKEELAAGLGLKDTETIFNTLNECDYIDEQGNITERFTKLSDWTGMRFDWARIGYSSRYYYTTILQKKLYHILKRVNRRKQVWMFVASIFFNMPLIAFGFSVGLPAAIVLHSMWNAAMLKLGWTDLLAMQTGVEGLEDVIASLESLLENKQAGAWKRYLPNLPVEGEPDPGIILRELISLVRDFPDEAIPAIRYFSGNTGVSDENAEAVAFADLVVTGAIRKQELPGESALHILDARLFKGMRKEKVSRILSSITNEKTRAAVAAFSNEDKIEVPEGVILIEPVGGVPPEQLAMSRFTERFSAVFVLSSTDNIDKWGQLPGQGIRYFVCRGMVTSGILGLYNGRLEELLASHAVAELRL